MNSIMFVNDTVGCVVGNEGKVFTTGNGGKNWSPAVSNTTSDLRDVYLQENGEGSAVGYDGTIIHTTDYGNSWTAGISPTTNTLYGIEKDYAAGWGGVILGNSGGWVFESSGFLDNIYGIDFGADALRGFAVGENGHVYYSSNAGENWTSEDSITNVDLYAIDVISGKPGWTPLAVIAGQSGKVFYGSSGNWLDRSIPTTDHLYAVKRIGGNAWVASEWGRIFRTTDYGHNWDLIHEDLTYHLYAIHFISKKYGWAAGMSGTVLKTTNGGQEWTDVSPNESDYFRSIYFFDTQLGWVVGNNGAIFKTTDAGLTWTSPQPKVTSATLHTVKFVNQTTGWIAGAHGTVLHTTDGGEHWYHQDSKGIGELRSMCFADMGTGWIAGWDGLILHTNNGGGAVTYGEYFKRYLDIFIPDPGELSDTINIGMSPGISGSSVVSGVSVIIDSIIHPDVSELVVILSHEGFSDTLIAQGEISGSDIIQCDLTDASSLPLEEGESPYADNFIPYKPLSAFNGTNPEGEWKLTVIDRVSGNAGKLQSWGLKLYFETLTGIEKDPGVLPEDFHLYQNYPNPFNPLTTIQFGLSKRSHVVIKLYNMLGQEVMTVLAGSRQAGTHEVQIDASKLSSGVYLYQLKSENDLQTKKMVLIK